MTCKDGFFIWPTTCRSPVLRKPIWEVHARKLGHVSVIVHLPLDDETKPFDWPSFSSFTETQKIWSTCPPSLSVPISPTLTHASTHSIKLLDVDWCSRVHSTKHQTPRHTVRAYSMWYTCFCASIFYAFSSKHVCSYPTINQVVFLYWSAKSQQKGDHYKIFIPTNISLGKAASHLNRQVWLRCYLKMPPRLLHADSEDLHPKPTTRATYKLMFNTWYIRSCRIQISTHLVCWQALSWQLRYSRCSWHAAFCGRQWSARWSADPSRIPCDRCRPPSFHKTMEPFLLFWYQISVDSLRP